MNISTFDIAGIGLQNESEQNSQSNFHGMMNRVGNPITAKSSHLPGLFLLPLINYFLPFVIP